MKTLHNTILILAVAISAMLCATGCYRSSSNDEISRETLDQVRAEIASEISNLNTDSLSNRVVFVQPTVVSSNDSGSAFSPKHIKNLIPIFGIVIPFAAVVGIFWVVMYYRRARQRDKYQLIEFAIRNGQPLPDSFYQSERKHKSRLQSGIVWIGVGIALIVWGIADNDTDTVAIGIIPLFVGIARIITYFIDDRKALKASQATENDAQQD